MVGGGGGVASQVALVVKNPPARAGGIRDTVQSLGREDPLEEGMATHPSILPGESHGQRNLVGYSPWGCKELDATEHTHTYLSEDNADILCFTFIIFKGDLMSFMFKAYILFPAFFLFW